MISFWPPRVEIRPAVERNAETRYAFVGNPDEIAEQIAAAIERGKRRGAIPRGDH